MATSQQRSSSRGVSSQRLKSFEALVLASGIGPDAFFKNLRGDLARTPDPIRAANNFHRFLSSGFSSSLLHDFRDHPVLQQILLELFGQSQYLADILVRDPELFRWLTAGDVLRIAKSKSDLLSEAFNAVQLFSRTEKKLDSLKRFHRREILRIGARDILREADVVVITGELSDLADAIIETVLEIGLQDLASRTGARFRSTLAVLGLGKLGGQELNFSSDIDLLFVYDQDGEFEAPQERIRTYHEYYNRLSEFVVRRLSEITGEGYLYRVDMRLRPEGSAGSLAISKSASLQYYEVRGEIWERQMLVKARPLGGNLDVGREWITKLTPFVFPKTFLQSPLREISAMKQRIEERTDAEANIKLGSGGIRDIEFIVQALQLLNGGQDERVRDTNTLQALDRLARLKRLRRSDRGILDHAYRFFRVVEHRLQLLHGAQTHSLPETTAEVELLARRLGYRTGREFAREISVQRKKVRKIFDLIFEKKAIRRRSPAAQGKRLNLAFIEKEESSRLVAQLGRRVFPEADGLNRFLRVLRKRKAPDWGLRNFALLAEQPAIRRTLKQALTNDELLDLLILICSRSSRMAELLSREPLLFETLAGQPEEFFRDERAWSFLAEHDLVRYKLFNEFKIIVPFLLGQASIETTVLRLSELADWVLVRRCREIPIPENVAVVALGKQGGHEITVGSDLDLIAVYQNEEQANAEKMVKSLASSFEGKKPYGVDFRLRPEGKNAPLASELGYYREYLETRASLWERQSLTKARVVTSGPHIDGDLKDLWTQTIYEAPLPDDWISQIKRMRARIETERPGKGSGSPDLKTGKGGLMDLEFLLQSLQLCFGRTQKLLRVQNSFMVVRLLAKTRILRAAETRKVQKNLEYLRTLETSCRLNGERSGFILPKDPVEAVALASFMGESSPASFKKKLSSIRKENRALFTTVLGRIRRKSVQ